MALPPVNTLSHSKQNHHNSSNLNSASHSTCTTPTHLTYPTNNGDSTSTLSLSCLSINPGPIHSQRPHPCSDSPPQPASVRALASDSQRTEPLPPCSFLLLTACTAYAKGLAGCMACDMHDGSRGRIAIEGCSRCEICAGLEQIVGVHEFVR
jgi:hypothetical protein